MSSRADLSGIQCSVLELISLLEVIDEQAADISFGPADDSERKNITQVQNLASIAVVLARGIDGLIDEAVAAARAVDKSNNGDNA